MRLGHFQKGLVIAGILRPHEPVPPGKVETKIIAGVGMMQVVMGDGCHPVEKWSAPPVSREKLVARMPDGVAKHHVRDEDHDRHGMRGQDKQDQRQVDRIGHRLAQIEAVGGERRRVVRPVMKPVKPAKERRIMQQAV